ncbi:glycoside hydrolase family 16 protein [Microbacterium sp. NIBRBAC000506063]|uniref:glycoside hydrolase family 16 protein n=1 Tax=Microbacterium sp. NIBRBAC000506063 TaxID=2734618 RepID=UPI001BB60561|nr:glycoside hydrolase family 16 protein [Microbacterium sp. NIBRBAC000506063]QTV79356.1 glycoside hydrolase family 16 protein [Microbacterium sp. NIBRBAC000506063]
MPLTPRRDPHRFILEFADDFSGAALDPDKWIAEYLPQWTAPGQGAARYDIDERGLRLRIDADQPEWRDGDGGTRVSSIQTGLYSGRAGSDAGTHRYTPGLVVRTPVPTRRLWTPAGGFVEATLSASADPTCMLAVWLVGLEERSPEESGEITIAELFGDAVSPAGSRVRLGVKAINDPRAQDDVIDVPVDFDAAEPHRYAAAWDADSVDFYVDDRLVHHVDQGFDYPMQLMIDLFEFPASALRKEAEYPKSACVHGVRGYRLR